MQLQHMTDSRLRSVSRHSSGQRPLKRGKKKHSRQSSRLYTCKVIKVVLRRENENMGDVTVRWHQGAARYYIEHQVFINVVCVCVCV
jgi:hypothetical protein